MEIKLKDYEVLSVVTMKDEILRFYHSEKVVYEISRDIGIFSNEYLVLEISILLDNGVKDFIHGSLIKEYSIGKVAD